MPVIVLTVTDAHAAQRDGATLIDVRSRAEFSAGRPAGAINVPLQDHDEDTGQMMPNPDFVRVMKVHFTPDTPLLICCETGGRSCRAAQMLEAFGFTSIANVDGGYARWVPVGLPVETAVPAGRTYAELLAEADDREA